MKRCIICNYRARTTKRLLPKTDTDGRIVHYVCRDKKLCDRTATRKNREVVNA